MSQPQGESTQALLAALTSQLQSLTVQPNISAVSIKLPEFWTTSPEVWFARVEAQFGTKNISLDQTKYDYVVGALDVKTAEEVQDVLVSPPETNKFNTLKSALLKAFGKSQAQRDSELLNLNGLGDRKPTALLRRINALNYDPQTLKRALFLSNLPADIRSILAGQDLSDIDKLAEAADRIWETRGAGIQQITHDACTGDSLPPPPVQAVSRPRFQPQRRPGFKASSTQTVNFVVAESSGILLGFLLRTALPHSINKPTWRLSYCLFWGIAFLLFLIGKSIWVVFLQIMVCYFMMRYGPQRHMQILVFFFALGYMLFNYAIRINLDTSFYDETYPLMVTTQKLTSLAFGLSDWRLMQKDKKMTPEREKFAVREMPSLLEFLAFTLSFQGVLAGPFCHWNLYRAFIEGNTKARLSEDTKHPVRYEDDPASVWRVVGIKVAAVVFWTYFNTALKPVFPDTLDSDPDFIAQHNILYRAFHVYLAFFLQRSKYYVTWILADAVYNASGLGYTGKDENGQPQWTGMTNVNVFKIETAPCLKIYLDNWNIMTTHWLRHVCYMRAPFLNTLFTFILSALWHGVHPGYYITFVAASFFVQAGRKARANIRPLFQGSTTSRLVYDAITTLATHASLPHLVFSFVVRDSHQILCFHKSFYFIFYIIVGCLCVFLPQGKKRRPTSPPPSPEKEPPQSSKGDSNDSNHQHLHYTQQNGNNNSPGSHHEDHNAPDISSDLDGALQKRGGESVQKT